jgi:hypothetical protein
MAVLDPIRLTTAQQFEQERMARFIDETSDIETMRSIAKLLLQGWMTQKAAATWAIHQAAGNRNRN